MCSCLSGMLIEELGLFQNINPLINHVRIFNSPLELVAIVDDPECRLTSRPIIKVIILWNVDWNLGKLAESREIMEAISTYNHQRDFSACIFKT